MTIIEFLEARITEDEALAKAATTGPWRYHPGKVWYHDKQKLAVARTGNPFVAGGEEFVAAGPDDGNNETTLGVASTGPADDPEAMSSAAHIARFDPIRVLSECAAKRAIVQMAQDSERYGYGTVTDGVKRETLGLAVRALAAVYADHPDYDPDWAL